MLFTTDGPQWKAMRKNVQSVLSPTILGPIVTLQELESRVVLYDFLIHGNKSVTETYVEGPHGEIPDSHWFNIIRRYATSVILTAASGNRIHQLENNHEMHRIYETIEQFVNTATPGAYVEDAIPTLNMLPDSLAPWRTTVRNKHIREYGFFKNLFQGNKPAALDNLVRGGFVNKYLSKRTEAGIASAPGRGLTEDGVWMRDKLVTYVGAALIEAGSDTVSATVETFVLMMLSHPHVLRRAREEVDQVVGAERMPTYEDEQQLPYLVACIKETLRRRTPTPLGIPHETTEDDTYGDYFIPKGTTVIGNIWAMHMDPVRFPNPMAFDPERFYTPGITTPWGSGPSMGTRDHFSFGWGRRFCAGTRMAETSLFILLSRLVWGIEFAAPINRTTGKSVLPDIADDETWNGSFIGTPHIFPVGFQARSEKHAEIIRKSFELVQDEWQAHGLAGDSR